MKRIYFLILALLTLVGGVNAKKVETEKWTGSEAVSWNGDIPGTQFETPSGIFSGLEEGDVIKVYTSVTGAEYGDPQYVLTYKAGDSWSWTDLTVSVDGDGVISYTVESATVASEIADRGLVFRGQNWTATKITVTKEETTPGPDPEPEVPAFSLDNFTADGGNSYDAETHTLTVNNAWSGGQLWIGENSTYSGSKLVIKTTDDSKLKVLVGYVGGGEVDMMDSEATKTHTLETDNTKKIEKVIIQNQEATAVTFESMELDPEEDPEPGPDPDPEVTYEDVTLFEGATPTGDWATHVDLAWDNRGELANARMNDCIRMTYTVTAGGAQAAIQNAGWQSLIGKDDDSYAAEGDNTGKTLTLTIDDAGTLENIQQNGILGRGKYITITKIELCKASNRYDAVPLTIGSNGICTYGSSKNLDFSGIDGVTPYYVSEVNTGSVTLTPVDVTRAWAGYIVKGTPGTYNVPVNATEPEWIDAFSYLRYSGDYNGNWVYRSAYSDYSGGGDNEAKIKNYYRYILAKDKHDDTKVGFYKLATDFSRVTTEKEGDNESGTTVYYYILNAHKAYLETEVDIAPSGDSNARLVLKFGDEDDPTAISEVKSAAQPVKADNVYYKLNGQRVEKPTKGIYILNGRKVLF